MSQHSSAKSRVAKGRRYLGSEIVFNVILTLFVLLCVLPVIHVIAKSISGRAPVLAGKVFFLPKELDFNAYASVFNDPTMIRSMWFSIQWTLIYTGLAMVSTILLAYPLTKKRLRGRKAFNLLALFTMYFSGGTIPIFLNIVELGLVDTPWALILPGMLSTYNMIILKSFFQSLPNELEEAAIIDGANDFQVLLRVYLPLSMASLATLTLFYAVGKWNSFQDALYYIRTKKEFQPLQLKLYNAIQSATRGAEISAQEGMGAQELSTKTSESIRPATIIFSTLPILVVYPFVQRYFVAGVTIGAVKG